MGMSMLWLCLRTRVSVLNATLSERRRTLRLFISATPRCQSTAGAGAAEKHTGGFWGADHTGTFT